MAKLSSARESRLPQRFGNVADDVSSHFRLAEIRTPAIVPVNHHRHISTACPAAESGGVPYTQSAGQHRDQWQTPPARRKIRQNTCDVSMIAFGG